MSSDVVDRVNAYATVLQSDDQTRILETLNRLRTEQMDIDTLKATRIAAIVNKLTKRDDLDATVRELAGELVDEWETIVNAAVQAQRKQSDSQRDVTIEKQQSEPETDAGHIKQTAKAGDDDDIKPQERYSCSDVVVAVAAHANDERSTPEWSRLFIMSLPSLLCITAMIVPDLAMISINSADECTLLSSDGKSQILDDGVTMSQTMYSVAIIHLIYFFLLFGLTIRRGDWGDWRDLETWAKAIFSYTRSNFFARDMCVRLVLCIPLFILWGEADVYGINSDSCYGVLVAWPMINLCIFCLQCCVWLGSAFGE